MITKVVVTYEDGTEAVFVGTPAVPAKPVDLSQIPLQSPAEQAVEPQA